MENRDVIEIDLLLMMKKLLLQWKAIIIVALLMGLLVMNVQYFKEKSVAQIEAVNVEETLTEDEIEAVNVAVSLNQKITEWETYISDSPYMSIDSLDYNQLSMVLTIHADAGTDARDITALYISEMNSNDYAEEIIEGMNKKAKASYFASLLSVSSSKEDSSLDTNEKNTDQLKVNIIVPDGWSQDKFIEVVQSATEEIEIDNYDGLYTTTLDYIDVNKNSSFEIQQYQKSITDSVSTMKSQLETNVDAFSDGQNELYSKLISDNLESATDSDDTTESETVVAPQLGLKYFVLGFLMGVFLYVVAYSVIVCFGKKTYADIHDDMQLSVLCLSEKSGIRRVLFDDGILKKILFKKEMDIESGMQTIGQKVQIAMKGQDDGKVFVLISSRILAKIHNQLAETLKAVNADIYAVDSKDDITVFINLVRMEDAYLIVTEDGVTTKEDMAALKGVSAGNDIQYLGQISVL